MRTFLPNVTYRNEGPLWFCGDCGRHVDGPTCNVDAAHEVNEDWS